MSLSDDMARGSMADKRFPRRNLKSCWGCAYAFGEYVWEDSVHVQCEHRYEGLNDENVKWRDIVHFDEVCPLWTERTGKMEIRPLVAGE